MRLNDCCGLEMVGGGAGRAQGATTHTHVAQGVDYVRIFSRDWGQWGVRMWLPEGKNEA